LVSEDSGGNGRYEFFEERKNPFAQRLEKQALSSRIHFFEGSIAYLGKRYFKVRKNR